MWGDDQTAPPSLTGRFAEDSEDKRLAAVVAGKFYPCLVLPGGIVGRIALCFEQRHGVLHRLALSFAEIEEPL
jgi:hypothetical protein